MSTIRITFDTATAALTFINEAGPYYCDFVAALNRHGQTIDLKGFSYGATVSINNEVALEKSYPPAGIKYVSTDQDVLTTERLAPFPPDAECHIAAWVETPQGRVEEELTFTIPRPEQPYESWTWNGESWEAPLPYPDGDGIYTWDEEQGDWVEMTEEQPAD